MTARQDLLDDGQRVIAELAQDYRAAVTTVVDLVRTATGVDLTPAAQPPIMDATRDQIQYAAIRARYAVALADMVLHVHWGDAKTLGECVTDPYWSDADRERIADLIVRAGLS